MQRPPMVAIIGRKHSGKTTLVVRLAAELHRRGHRVMTIKHGAHTFNIDPSTTDTYRHYHEGHAERVAMAAPDKFALIMRWSDELGPEEIATRHMSDADIVLCEGFKRSALPKVEIHRREAHESPLLGGEAVEASTYRAMVTDDDRVTTTLPIIRLDADGWLEKLADFVEVGIMNR
ncbi:MAG TPA: molybdopterin-guanine dinucleotide biosynthesis protein B [Gemmatimonadaceae bacterium]